METITADNHDFTEFLISTDGCGCRAVKYFGDGTYAAVKPLLFHWTMIFGFVGDRQTFEDAWCYQHLSNALVALELWDGKGDPQFWHRHPKTGRRRPEGDAAQEYVAW